MLSARLPGVQTCALPISWSLLKLMSIESVMPSNHLVLCYPLLLLPSIFPSIRVFSNELAFCIRWLQYWSVSFSISPSDEYSGLISFRTNSFDLPAVEGTLKSLLQYHSSKASILQRSACCGRAESEDRSRPPGQPTPPATPPPSPGHSEAGPRPY